METRKSIEDKAHKYADTIELHPCAYRRGLKQGFIEGYQQALRQPLVSGSLPFEFIKMYWGLADGGVEQLVEAYKIWEKGNVR